MWKLLLFWKGRKKGAKMKLRSFSYLNTNIVKEYISMIDGYTYDEESRSVATFSENPVY